MVSTRSSRKRKPKATTPKSSAKKQKKATPKSSKKKATPKRKSSAKKKKASPAPTAPLEAARSYQRQSTLVAGLREEDFVGQDRGMQLRPHHRTDGHYTGSSSTTKKSAAKKKKATPKSKKKTPRAKTPKSSTRAARTSIAVSSSSSSSTTTTSAFNPVPWMALAVALALLLREGAVRNGAEGSTMFFTGPPILPDGARVLNAAWLVFIGAVIAMALK